MTGVDPGVNSRVHQYINERLLRAVVAEQDHRQPAQGKKDVVVAHKEALDREARAQAIIAKFEEGVKADTKTARAKAADLQAQIDAATKERTALAATLPADVLTDYERLLKQFRGLAVETIQGNIPTVCHTALQASSMSDLNHDGSEITHCPYCHRLLVLPSKEA